MASTGIGMFVGGSNASPDKNATTLSGFNPVRSQFFAARMSRVQS